MWYRDMIALALNLNTFQNFVIRFILHKDTHTYIKQPAGSLLRSERICRILVDENAQRLQPESQISRLSFKSGILESFAWIIVWSRFFWAFTSRNTICEVKNKTHTGSGRAVHIRTKQMPSVRIWVNLRASCCLVFAWNALVICSHINSTLRIHKVISRRGVTLAASAYEPNRRW